MARRATAKDARNVLLVAAVGLPFGAIISWAFKLLLAGLDLVGIKKHDSRADLFRDHPWQAGLTIGAAFAVFAGGAALREVKRQTGWRGLTPRWVWPSSIKESTTVAVRSGRVLHWLMMILAAAVLVLSAIGSFQEWASVPEQQAEHAAWEARHPVGSDGYRTGRDVLGTFPGDPEPYIPTADYSFFIGLVGLGAALALIGRGLRYILAGE